MKKTILNIQHSDKPIVCLTAYTKPMAQILDKYCDIILVGDSLGTALYGMENTLGVTLDMMINHGKAVMRGSQNAIIVVDMPYGTYEDSIEQSLITAKRIIEETKCDAVKLEGGSDMADRIKAITDAGIPVMAHIGLQPQSVEKEGGYKIKGKTEESIERLLADAKAIEKSGAFSVVIEGTIEEVARLITSKITIPTIGIGASAQCSGQILVTDDMLGLITDHTPKFVKKYADLAETIKSAVQEYKTEVQSKAFPTEEYTYKGKI